MGAVTPVEGRNSVYTYTLPRTRGGAFSRDENSCFHFDQVSLTRCPVDPSERLGWGVGESGLYFAASVSVQNTGSKRKVFPSILVHYRCTG